MNYSMIEKFRDISIGVGVLVLSLVVSYKHLYPTPAAATAPDRIETTGLAHLKSQPAGLIKVAGQIEAGIVAQGDETAIAKAITASHKGAADDLAAALKSENYSPSALRRAAESMTKGLK